MKSKVSVPDLKINNNKVLPINTKAGKTLSNEKCLSTNICKRKSSSKSETMFVSNMVPFNAENEETVKRKMCLNEYEVINYKESNTKKLVNCNLVKKLEVPKKYNHNFSFMTSNLKYPPPYILTLPHNNQLSWKNVPPKPKMMVKTSRNKVKLTWDLHSGWENIINPRKN